MVEEALGCHRTGFISWEQWRNWTQLYPGLADYGRLRLSPNAKDSLGELHLDWKNLTRHRERLYEEQAEDEDRLNRLLMEEGWREDTAQVGRELEGAEEMGWWMTGGGNFGRAGRREQRP